MTAAPLTPNSVLIDLIGTLLAPMFLLAANGDIPLAQRAALQTINAYRIQHQADIVTVAQIVAFGLATLGSLGLSMDDTLSLSMILRLRGNANACNRSGEQLRRALRESHQATSHRPAAPHEQPAPAATQAAPPAEAPAPAQPQPTPSPTQDQQRRAAWAAAFTEVAAEYTAELPNLPPEEQRAASIRVAALNSSATAMLSGASVSQTAPGPSLQPNTLRPKPA